MYVCMNVSKDHKQEAMHMCFMYICGQTYICVSPREVVVVRGGLLNLCLHITSPLGVVVVGGSTPSVST